MIYCSVKGCYCYKKDGSKQRFFRFPTAIKRSWLWHEFCQDASVVPSCNKFVCDKHFVESDFDTPELLKLKNTAIPSVNGPDRTNMKKTNSENTKEKITISACDGNSMSLDSGYSLDITCHKPNDSSLPSQLNLNNLSNLKSSKIYNHEGCVMTSPDLPDLVLEQNSNVRKRSGSLIKSYKKIDSKLKLSLLESVDPTMLVEQKLNSNLHRKPLKTYKSVQKDLEVKLQPQIVFPDEIEQELAEPNIKNGVLKLSQKRNILFKDYALENLDVTVNSTLVLESKKNSIRANSKVNRKVHKYSVPNQSGDNSEAEHTLTNENDSLKSSPLKSTKKKTKQNTINVDLVSSHTGFLPMSVQKKLNKINENHRKKLQRYRNRVLKNSKSFPSHLNVNDPKYSIAAMAESLGTFNSYMEEPVEKVCLEDDEWHKLYDPSQTKFPRLSEIQMGAMVNNLRTKLPTLNSRDKLEVSFLLSMMSVYPIVPKHIKDLLSQRLNLVYIATMFEWNTALALGLNAYKQGTTSNTDARDGLSTVRTYRNKKFQSPIIPSTSKSSCDSVQSGCDSTNYLSVISKVNLVKPVKRPQFAFEIVVKENSSETK